MLYIIFDSCIIYTFYMFIYKTQISIYMHIIMYSYIMYMKFNLHK